MFVDPGDTVILEEFCYAGAINRFKRVGANIIGIPLDEDGHADRCAGLAPWRG